MTSPTRIAELVAQARANCIGSRSCNEFADALEACARDSARLDAMERKELSPYYGDGKWRIPYEVSGNGGFGGGVGEYTSDSLRGAIDVAMEHTP